MKNRLLLFLGLLLAGVFLNQTKVMAQDAVMDERLLFMDIPSVISATKQSQPINEAPAAISIISSEDIKLSAATNLADVLRLAPGVDIRVRDARSAVISIRGIIAPGEVLAQKIMFLIDGRTIYSEIDGFIEWDNIPVGLEEIDHIEIVRSPGSSLWGANAYCGVINIITKTPEQMHGAQVVVKPGNNTNVTTIMYGEKFNNFYLKASGEYDTAKELINTNTQTAKYEVSRINRANFLSGYKFAEDGKAEISAGRAQVKQVGTVVGFGVTDSDYMRLMAEYKGFKFDNYANLEFDARSPLFPYSQTFNTELQNSFDIYGNNIIWSISHRYVWSNYQVFYPTSHSQHLSSGFLQDQYDLMQNLKLIVAGRLSWHPVFGNTFSPKGNLVWKPMPDQILTLGCGTATRYPAFHNMYANSGAVQSDPNIVPEQLTSYELGYRAQWLNRIKSSVDLFYNMYDKYITKGPVPGQFFGTRFTNGGKVTGLGGELGLEASIADWLSSTANYSYEEVKDLADDPFSPTINETNLLRTAIPRNKFNVGFKMKSEKGLITKLEAEWQEHRIQPDTNTSRYLYLRDFTIFNVTMLYPLSERSEASLSIYNLFNQNYMESMDEELERRITARISFSF